MFIPNSNPIPKTAKRPASAYQSGNRRTTRRMAGGRQKGGHGGSKYAWGKGAEMKRAYHRAVRRAVHHAARQATAVYDPYVAEEIFMAAVCDRKVANVASDLNYHGD